MDSHRRREMRRAHTKHAYHCSCGKIVHGNGGKAGHEYMHERRDDGHHWLIRSTFYERFPDAPGAPMKPGETLDEYRVRIESAR